MKLLFLFITFFLLIMTVKAQRQTTQYTCQVSHKHHKTAFYLTTPESRSFSLGSWKLNAGIREVNEEIEVSLKRTVNIMDATYEKSAREVYPGSQRSLPITLQHPFGGKIDVFNMTCYPRDP